MKEQPKKLVISGGATKIYASIGAVSALEEQGRLNDLHSYIGTSAGSVLAALLALGCSSKDIKKYYDEIDTSHIDINYFSIMTYLNVINKNGIHHSCLFVSKIIHPLLQKVCGNGDITFLELYNKYNKTLVITGTCLNKRETHYYQYQSNPDMKIKNAIQISCALPILFRPILWDGDVMVDGGILENYPIYYFSNGSLPNSKEVLVVPKDRVIDDDVLGIKFIDDQVSRDPNNNFIGEGNNGRISNVFEYLLSIFNTVHTSDERRLMTEDYWKKTIPINLGTFNTISNIVLSDTQKETLFKAGYDAAENFFL